MVICQPTDGQMLSAPTEQTPKYAVGADIIRPENGEANSCCVATIHDEINS